MKIKVHPGVCTGHARCASLAADVYPLDDAGYNELRYVEVPVELEDAAVRGAMACPEKAITLIEPPAWARDLLDKPARRKAV